MAPSKLSVLGPTGPALGLLGLASVLGGCAAMHDGFEATARLAGPPIVSENVSTRPIRTDVKVVRSRGVPESPRIETAAVPSPRDIFDFHPAGTRPDGWRQPFDIDVADGPLAGDVRRSQAELKAYKAEQKTAAVMAARKPCSETDVATARQGCATKPVRPTATVARDPTALQ